MKDFLEYTRNRQMLCFHKLEQPKVSCLRMLLTAYQPATVVKPACCKLSIDWRATAAGQANKQL